MDILLDALCLRSECLKKLTMLARLHRSRIEWAGGPHPETILGRNCAR
jgi:hypothetical protein